MKSVFTARPGSGYDDILDQQYHFPRTYISQAEKSVGDFILYYEPRRGANNETHSGGRQSYFAVALLEQIEVDPTNTDLFYGRLSGYLDFDQMVPFKLRGSYFESALKRSDGNTNRGAFGRAIRNIPDQEFEAILSAGFDAADFEKGQNTGDAIDSGGFSEVQLSFERPMVERVTAQPFRNDAFRRNVRRAYGMTCAMTGLKILNGGGRPEVDAAHIKPVADAGSDSIRNGLALSKTVHWMFDRGLVSIDNDHQIIVADGMIPDQARNLISPNRQLLVPEQLALQPHPAFLQYHRENIFKG